MFPARPRDPEPTATALRAWLGTKVLGVTDLVVSDVSAPQLRETATEVVAFRADWNRTDQWVIQELTGHQIHHLDSSTGTPHSLIGAAQ